MRCVAVSLAKARLQYSGMNNPNRDVHPIAGIMLPLPEKTLLLGHPPNILRCIFLRCIVYCMGGGEGGGVDLGRYIS